MQLKQRLEHIEADLFNTDKGYSTRCQLIAEQANQLVFSPEILVDLSPHALTPCISLSAKASTYYALEAAIPLLRGKIVQWRLHIQPSCSTLFFKLGSGGRINNCDLILSIFQQQVHQLQLVATSQIAGHQVQDNQWSAFSFTQPLPPGDYIGQLSSPNADNQNNTLFLWLTVELTHTILMPSGELLDLYRYGLQPVISLSATTPMDAHISVPLLQHYTLQWYWDLSQETTVLSHCFLKLGTQGKVNHCHLVLSFFAEQQDCFHLVTTAYLDGVQAQDGQWSQLNFEHPLPPNNYLCRLQSPDSDNTDNTLFIWLTTYGSPYYCYLPLPVASLETELAQLQKLPLITLLMVIPTQSHYWQQCLESIVNQSYPYWQLCIVSEHTHPELQAYQHHFGKQIILMTEAQPRNPYQTALTSAQGEYVALVHPDDLLSVNALLEIVKYINQATQPVDMLYSDEDKVNQSGLLDEPYFKPAWSAELLKGYFYTGQLTLYRTQLVQAVGGLRESLYQSGDQSLYWARIKHIYDYRQPLFYGQLWDLSLRISAHTKHIHHLAIILYHQRRQPLIFQGPSLAQEIAQIALAREGRGGHASLNTLDTCLIHYPLQGQPLVSIIIPHKDKATLLSNCLASLSHLTHYSNWELVIVDNGSQEPQTWALFEHYQQQLGNRFQVVSADIAFNFSTLVNRGVQAAQGEMILLLNNDTQLLGPTDWLSTLIGFAQHPEIGCVGCKLLYPDNTIQHAGLICGVAGIANHGHKHVPVSSLGYFNRLAVVANYAAITGACMMVERRLWERVNGFDDNLAIAFNDVDFCLQLFEAGWRHVVLPQVQWYHYESKTRGLEDTWEKQQRLAQEEQYMRQRWQTLLHDDPFYNPHLSRYGEDFDLNLDSIYRCENGDSLNQVG